MKMFRVKRNWHSGVSPCGGWKAVSILVLFILTPTPLTRAQTASQENLAQQIQQLTDAMAKTQAKVDESQRELIEMRKQLGELQRQMSQNGTASATPASPPPRIPRRPRPHLRQIQRMPRFRIFESAWRLRSLRLRLTTRPRWKANRSIQ